MKTLICLSGLLCAIALHAQPLTEVKESSLNLMEQYQKMKLTSETFNEYKVIRENVLDKTWHTFYDSIKARRLALQQAHAEIVRLEGALNDLQKQWKEKEDSMSSMEFKGTHISFLGIEFGKKTFISIVLIVLCSLIALSGLISIQMKSMLRYQRERSEVMDALSKEFEEYKRKTLEKQTRLSRELQNERNRVVELRKV
ncbi:MAG TPA: hypothetical protein PLR06_00745 [Cyclobacteriaceae bacterium]|nr:hypothetical protein [Cyclobacteriaceae bacterium]